MATAATTQKMTARHILVVLTCVFCTFGCAAITFSCPGLCYRPVANYLGVQVSDVSFYMSIVYFAEVIFSPIIGALLEKYDARIICTIAAVFTSGGIFCMSFYTELWQWYVSGFFMGVGEITLLWLCWLPHPAIEQSAHNPAPPRSCDAANADGRILPAVALRFQTLVA